MQTDRTSVIGAFGALRILRAPQWLHFLALPAAGLDAGALSTRSGLARLALGMTAAGSALGYAYGINAIADRASDESRAKNPLAGSLDVPPEALAVVIAAAACSVFAAAALGVRALAFASGSLVAGTLYSVGPRLKSVPILGLTLNTLIFAPLLVLCAPLSPSPASEPAFAAIAATFVALILQNQLLHEAADAGEDARAGAMTTARLLGVRATRLVVPALALPFTALAASASPGPRVALSAGLAILAGSAVSVLIRDAARARRVHRWVSTLGGAALFVAGVLW